MNADDLVRPIGHIMFINRALALTAAALAATSLSWTVAPVARADDEPAATCGGTVFDDLDVDGLRDEHEPGVGDATIRITDRGGRLSVVSTDDAGHWSLDVGAERFPIRIEFETPDGYRPSRLGDDNGTDVQFVPRASECDGSPLGSFAVYEPGAACGSDLVLVSGCFTAGDADEGAHSAAVELISLDVIDNGSVSGDEPDDWLSPAPVDVGGAADLGSVYGLAADHRRTIYAATFVKRHAALRSALNPTGNPTTIFRIAPGRAPAVLTTIDPDATPPRPPLDGDEWRSDPDTFDDVFRLGLGDLDVSPDGTRLFTIDLGRRELVTIALPSGEILDRLPLTGRLLGIDDCGVGEETEFGDLRAFGLGFDSDDDLLIGVVCSAESTVTKGDVIDERETPDRALGDPDWLVGHVFEMADPTREIPPRRLVHRLSWPLSNDRGDTRDNGLISNDATWHPWVHGVPFRDEHEVVSYPQPAITDLTVDGDGNLIVALGDRWGHQTIAESEAPTTDGRTYHIAETVQAGDLQRACPEGDGWVIEGSGECSGGWGNGFEHFDGDSYGWHAETALGSVVALTDDDSTTLIASQMNPVPGPDPWWSGGLAWHDAGAGDFIRGARLYDGRHADPDGTFEQASGITDLALLCDWAAIEVGGRLWHDLDEDGSQDPAEPAIGGVLIELRDSAGRVLGSTITNTTGRYSFDEGDVDGGMVDGDEFLITIADQNFQSGPFGRDGAHIGLRPTKHSGVVESRLDSDGRVGSATGPVTGLTTARVIAGDDPETSEVEGATDYSIDFGFRDQYDLALATRWVRESDTLGVLAYEIVIHNQGSEASGTFAVADQIPTGTSLIAASRGASPTQPGGNELRWSFHEGESLAPGETRRLTVLVRVDDDTQTPFVNTAQLTSASGDDDDSVPGDADFSRVTDRADAFRDDGTLIDDNGAGNRQDDADIATVYLHHVSGRVWADLDRDARYEPDPSAESSEPERAAAGVAVILKRRDGTEVEQQWTNHEGIYRFAMVPSDEYVIEIPRDEFAGGRPLGGFDWVQSSYRSGDFDPSVGIKVPITLEPGIDSASHVVHIGVAPRPGTPWTTNLRIEFLLPGLIAGAVVLLALQRRTNRAVAIAG